MNAILLSIFSFSTAITPPPLSHDPGTITLVRLLVRQCGADSTNVANTVRYLHWQYGVKRIVFTNSTTDANYYLLGGTLKIDSKDSMNICEKWTAELAHAVQFSRHFLTYSLLAIRDMAKTLLRSFTVTKDERQKIQFLVKKRHCRYLKARLWVVWQRTYHKAGSFEYLAHEVIEPKLKEIINHGFYYGPLAWGRFYIRKRDHLGPLLLNHHSLHPRGR